MSLLIFLHGYNSSPQALKARLTGSWLQKNAPDWQFVCPALSPFSEQAIKQLQAEIEREPQQQVGLVGSSMGGFYATWLAEKYDLRAVLINPAVKPHRWMSKYLGENANYHTGEPFVLEEKHIENFGNLDVGELKNPKNYRVYLQTGDEVLDYRDAAAMYQDCELIIEQGGDHSFQNYQQHMPDIFRFLSQG